MYLWLTYDEINTYKTGREVLVWPMSLLSAQLTGLGAVHSLPKAPACASCQALQCVDDSFLIYNSCSPVPVIARDRLQQLTG